MGSYWTLRVRDFEIASGKSDLEPHVTALFSETDRRSYRRSYDEHRFMSHEYAVGTAEMASRLEVYGFKIDGCRRAFERSLRARIKEQTEFLLRFEGEERAVLDASLERLRKLKFDRWLRTYPNNPRRS